jgi:hypothetical protein
MEPLKYILLLAARHDVLIEASWIPGVENGYNPGLPLRTPLLPYQSTAEYERLRL